MPAIALRHRAAVSALCLSGQEQVLEIGCGQGVATRLMLEALPGGRVLAIDRSEKMIEALARSAADALARGQLEVRAEALEEATLERQSFDRILAINVDLFLRLGESWAPMLKALLRTGGVLVIGFEAPPGSDKADAFADRAAGLLLGVGFHVKQTMASEGQARVAIVVAEPAGASP